MRSCATSAAACEHDLAVRDGQPVCTPNWNGSFHHVAEISAGRLQSLVGAQASFVEFKEVSGVAAMDDARTQLNARLAARGVPCCRRVARLHQFCALHRVL